MARLKNTTILNKATPQSKNKKDNKIVFEVWTVKEVGTREGYVKGNYAIHDVNRDEIAVTHLPSGNQLYKFAAYVGESKTDRRKKAYELLESLLDAPNQVFADNDDMTNAFKKYAVECIKKVTLK